MRTGGAKHSSSYCNTQPCITYAHDTLWLGLDRGLHHVQDICADHILGALGHSTALMHLPPHMEVENVIKPGGHKGRDNAHTGCGGMQLASQVPVHQAVCNKSSSAVSFPARTLAPWKHSMDGWVLYPPGCPLCLHEGRPAHSQ